MNDQKCGRLSSRVRGDRPRAASACMNWPMASLTCKVWAVRAEVVMGTTGDVRVVPTLV